MMSIQERNSWGHREGKQVQCLRQCLMRNKCQKHEFPIGERKKHVTVELGPRQTFGAPKNRHMSLGLDLGAMVTQNPARTGSYS